MRNNFIINSHKKLNDIDFNEPIKDLLRMTIFMLVSSTACICSCGLVFYILSKLIVSKDNYHMFDILMIALIIILYSLVISQFAPSWCKEFRELKRLKNILHNNEAAQKWKIECLSESGIGQFSLLYAKLHNLLDENEFEAKKELYITIHKDLIFGGEFITLIELRQELKISNEQFTKIKNSFINNPDSSITEEQSKVLQKYGVLTHEEAVIKANNKESEMRKQYLSIILKWCLFGAIFGAFIFAMSCLSK